MECMKIKYSGYVCAMSFVEIHILVRVITMKNETSLIHYNWECQFDGGFDGLAD